MGILSRLREMAGMPDDGPLTFPEVPRAPIAQQPDPEAGRLEPLRLAGRCRDGAERDGGSLYHAVARGAWRALCGAEPGRQSAGWSAHAGAAVTCPRCLGRMAGKVQNPNKR
jgi:hypothetical protein